MLEGPLLQSIPAGEDASLVRSFERHMKAENLRPPTISHRLITLRRFISYGQDEHFPRLKDIRKDHVESWMESLHEEGLSAHSVKSYSAALRAFYQWLLDEEEIDKHPMQRIKPPLVDEAQKDVASAADVRKVLLMLEKQKRWRDCVIVALIYNSGPRATEFADCLINDVDLDAGTMVLRHTKGRRSRTIPLSPRLVRYADRYLRGRKDKSPYFLHGLKGKMTRTGVYRTIRSAFKEAGVAGAVIGSHDLRHTSASHVVEKVGESDMMAVYGWQDASMVRHYTRSVRQKTALAAHQQASPLEELFRK